MENKVTIPYDASWKPLDWAKKHCPSYITNDVHKNEFNQFDLSKIDYYFSEQKDMILFLLRWV